MSRKDDLDYEKTAEDLLKEYEAPPSRSFYRFEPQVGIENHMHKGTSFHLEGLTTAQRLAMLNHYKRNVDVKEINSTNDYPTVKKTMRVYGEAEVRATYGKFWKRLREQAKPSSERREHRKEAFRRANRAEAMHVANTMILKRKKYFSQLSKLL